MGITVETEVDRERELVAPASPVAESPVAESEARGGTYMAAADRAATEVIQRLATGVIRRELTDGAASTDAAATPAAAPPAAELTTAQPTAAPAPNTVAPEPTVVVEPGAALSAESTAARFAQWATLKERLVERGYDSAAMVDLCARYVLAITAPAPAMDIVKNLLKEITDQLQASKAFDRHSGDSQDEDYTDGFNLWSGAKEQATKYGDENGGVALESSAAGSLFDGLNFDMKWNEALSHQWNELSRLYAEGIRGKVHIHQYRGVRTGSVFNKIEYPTIKDSIAAGLIEPVIHLYANHGPLTNVVWNTPIYGAGETSRKQEKILVGKSALDGMLASQWEYGDAVEKSGGYWPSGKGGEPADHTLSPGTKVRPGEAW